MDLMANYRNDKLLKLTRQVHLCQFQLPGVCEHYVSHGCEPAHSNNLIHGKGMGIKADDDEHVCSCNACNTEYDNGMKFTREEKRDYYERGWKRTMKLYIREELLVPNA